MSQKFKSQIDAEQGIKISNELYDGSAAAGNSGQVLSSTGSATQWVDLNADSAKRLEVDVKNVHGATLAKGTVVHAEPTGTLSGNVIEVVAADANSGRMPAIGVLNEDLADDAEGKAVMFGTVQGIDTSGFSVGDELYVSVTAGNLVATKPVATDAEVQKVAIVIKSHESNGLIKVFGAGRANDVPNLLTRDIAIEGADFAFGDSDQIQMGTPLGLRIQHASGGHSYIDGEVGNIYIRAEANDSDMIFQADDASGGNTDYVRLDGSTGAVNLYHYGSKKFETTNTGVSVNGKLVISSNQNNSNDFTWLLFDNQAAGYGDWNMFKSGNNDLAFGYGTSNGASFTNALTLKYGGNVGIGTTSPQSLLSLGNAADAQKLLLYDNNNNFKYGFGIQSDELRQFFPDSATARMVFGTISDSDGSTFSEKMRIDSSGNVGINDTISGNFTTNYDTKLLVGGEIIARSLTASASMISIGGDATSAFIKVGKQDGSLTARPLRIEVGTTEAMNIDSSGNVGIGETSPLVPLHISKDSASGENIALLLDNNNTTAGNEIGILFRSMAGSTNTDFEIFGKANGANDMDLVFQSDGSVERMRIDSSGNVGIGTTSPSNKLEVNGNIATDSYVIAGLGSGGVALTHNDGEGNANVTFNHVSGIPEQNGNSFRIRTNTDSSSGAVMRFEIKEGVTADTAVDTIEVFRLDPDGPKVRQAGGGNISLQRDDSSIVDGNPLGRIRFSGDDPTNDVYNRGVEIRAEAAGTWSTDNYPAELQFYTTATNSDLLALTLDSSQNAIFYGNITPNTDSTYNIGTNTVRFANVYADNLYGLAQDLAVTSNDTFNGTYSLLWHSGAEVYSSSFMTINGTTDTFSVPNISTTGNATFAGEVTATEYNLPSGGMLDWANGDARIVEGLVNNYSLSFQTWDGSAVSTALRLDGDNNATFEGNVGIGTGSPLEKLHVMYSDTAGISTVYSKGLIEDTDAQFDLLSTSAGTWGSALNFVESAGGNANTDVWSIARKTTGGSGDSSLNFNFGTTNQHSNTTRLSISSGGNLTAQGNIIAEGTLVTRSANANLTISGDTSGNVYHNSASGEHRWRANGSSVNSMTLSSSLLNINESTKIQGTLDVSVSGVPILYITDNGNSGGGGAEGRIIFRNSDASGGNAVGLGYTADETDNNDFIISTNAGSTYGGYLDLHASAIDDPSSIILDPKTQVLVTKPLKILDDTGLIIHTTTNGANAKIQFSDQTSDYSQTGTLTYDHVDGNSFGSANAFLFASSQTYISIIAGDADTQGVFYSYSKGSANEVDFGFANDLNTGMYRPGADQVGLVAGGSRKLLVNSTGVLIQNGSLNVPVGSAATPSIQVGDTDTGFYDSGTNEVAISTGGTYRAKFTPSGLSVSGSISPTNIVTHSIVKFDGNDLDDSLLKDDGTTLTYNGAQVVDVVNSGGRISEDVLFEITEADTTETVRKKLNKTSTAITRVDDASAPAGGCFEFANRYENITLPAYYKVDEYTEYTFEVYVRFISGTDTDQRLYAGASFYNNSKEYLGNTQRYWGESGEQIDANSRNDGSWYHFSGTLGPNRGSGTGDIPTAAEWMRLILLLNHSTQANTVRYCGLKFYKSGGRQARMITSLYRKSLGSQASGASGHLGRLVMNNSGNLYTPQYLYHTDDTDTSLNFGTNTLNLQTGGTNRVAITNSKVEIDNSCHLKLGDSGDVTDSGFLRIRHANSGEGELISLVRSAVRTWRHSINSSGDYVIRNVDGTYNVLTMSSDSNLGIGGDPGNYKLYTGTGNIRFNHENNGTARLELYQNRQDASNVKVWEIAAYNSVEVANIQFYRGGGGSTGYTVFQAKGDNAMALQDIAKFGLNTSSTSEMAATFYNGIYINDTNTRLHEGSSNTLRIQTGTGYVDIGPKNTSWCHFNTDRANFYFAQGASWNGSVLPYTSLAVNLGSSSRLWNTTYSRYFESNNTQSRTKLRVWSGSTYGIGMQTGYTFGAINNDYVMSFQMSNSTNRGFWWGDTGHSNAQGAMSLSTQGKLTVAHSIRLGYGESDTTVPGATYRLDVSGMIRATGDIIAFSDKRVKENIKTIDNSLEKVDQLRGVEFNKIGENKKSIGVIAQEIEEILPEVVSTDCDGMKSVAYGNITGVLIEAIKELKAEVEELKKQIK